MRGHIRESTPSKVGELRVVRLGPVADVLRQVRLHRLALIPRRREVVAEPAGARHPGDLGRHRLRAAHRGDIRTGAGELRRELGLLRPVVGLAGRADTGVARRLQHRNSPQPHQTDQVAHALGIVFGNGLLRQSRLSKNKVNMLTCSSSPYELLITCGSSLFGFDSRYS